jgi:hypothetical protein
MSSQIPSNDESAASQTDWRGQVEQHPLAFSAGALAAGFVIGYGLAGALGAGNPTGASSYSSQSQATGGADGIPAHAEGRLHESVSGISGQQTSYTSGSRDWYTAEASNKPGLMKKLKNTPAYDRLQAELSTLGDRLVNELSRAGREVLLPALAGKIAGLFGADPDGRQQQQENAPANGARSTGAA